MNLLDEIRLAQRNAGEDAVIANLRRLGLIADEPEPSQDSFTLNSSRTVAVSTEVYWLPISPETPRGVKLQLLGRGGVAHYGTYHGDPFWTHWQSVPKLENKIEKLGN